MWATNAIRGHPTKILQNTERVETRMECVLYMLFSSHSMYSLRLHTLTSGLVYSVTMATSDNWKQNRTVKSCTIINCRLHFHVLVALDRKYISKYIIFKYNCIITQCDIDWINCKHLFLAFTHWGNVVAILVATHCVWESWAGNNSHLAIPCHGSSRHIETLNNRLTRLQAHKKVRY